MTRHPAHDLDSDRDAWRLEFDDDRYHFDADEHDARYGESER